MTFHDLPTTFPLLPLHTKGKLKLHIAEVLKAEGNVLLKAGELQAAQRKYGEAVEAWKGLDAAGGGGDARVAPGAPRADPLPHA